jgi:hypothetical protein
MTPLPRFPICHTLFRPRAAVLELLLYVLLYVLLLAEEWSP